MPKVVAARLIRQGFLTIFNLLGGEIDINQEALRAQAYNDVQDLLDALNAHQVVDLKKKVIVVGFDEHGESYIAPGAFTECHLGHCAINTSLTAQPVLKPFLTSGIQYVEILE